MDLGFGDGDSWGTGVIWVIEEIAYSCNVDSVGLLFLRSYAAEKVGVCYILVFWNEVLACWLDGAGSFDAFFGKKEEAPFFSFASVPFGCIWSFENVLER